MSSFDLSNTLSKRKKILYTLLFIIGLSFSYATFMPIGIICASILLLQKKSRQFTYLGLFLFILQILVLIIVYNMWLDSNLLQPV
ncbi:MAG: hypothetical protein ACTSRS_07450 [Candidatus Helarchaeota archaeon]